MYKKSARNVKQNGYFKDIIAMQLALIIRVSLPVSTVIIERQMASEL